MFEVDEEDWKEVEAAGLDLLGSACGLGSSEDAGFEDTVAALEASTEIEVTVDLLLLKDKGTASTEAGRSCWVFCSDSLPLFSVWAACWGSEGGVEDEGEGREVTAAEALDKSGGIEEDT